MKNDLPEDTLRMLRELIAEGKPVEEIAFMMRLSVERVEKEMARVNTTKK